MFVVYINSIPNTVKSKLYSFADDAKLYREITSNKDVELLQEDQWIRKWKNGQKVNFLHFNENKGVHMIISNGGSNRETRSYDFYDKQLETVGEEKDLGVIIDSKLSFDSHIFAKVIPYHYTCIFKCL